MTNARIGINDRKMSRLKSQVQMTNAKKAPMTNAEMPEPSVVATAVADSQLLGHSSFGFWTFFHPSIPNSLVFLRGFVIRHSGFGLPSPPLPPSRSSGLRCC